MKSFSPEIYHYLKSCGGFANIDPVFGPGPKRLKVSLIGPPCSGKTSFMNSICDIYKETSPRFNSCDIKFETKFGELNIQINDSPAHSRLINLFKSFVKYSDISFIFFDLTQKSTFEELDEYDKYVEENHPNPQKILIGTKADLEELREVSQEQALQYVKSHNYLTYFEISSNLKLNIQIVLDFILE